MPVAEILVGQCIGALVYASECVTGQNPELLE